MAAIPIRWRPWKVYAAPLRPGWSAKIVEVHDARGRTILPWAGFDATGLSHTQQKKLAKEIVDAVNAERK